MLSPTLASSIDLRNTSMASTRLECAVDLHGVADPQRAAFHAARRDDPAVANDEHVFDCQPKHARSVPDL
jgi:hypothetical protein